MNILQAIGRATLNAGAAIWDVFALFFKTLYWLFFAPFIGKFIGRRYIFAQMVFAGVQSLMIVFFVALFIGIVLAMQGAYQLSQLGADWITFTSGSAVEHFHARFDLPRLLKQFPQLKLASIGPETSKTIRTLKMKPALEAKKHTTDGLIADLLRVMKM